MALASEVSVLIPALTSLPIAAIVTDTNGVVRWANADFTLTTGYALGEIVGQHAGVLESDNLKHTLQEILNHAFATGEPWKGETPSRFKDGEVHDIERTITPIRNGTGVVTHALWTLQQIAERKHSDLAGQDRHADFESFFTLLPDLGCVASTEGVLKKVNSTWQEALGYTPEELLETPFVAFLHPDDTDPKLGSGTTLQFVNRYRHKDGSYRWLEWRATPPIGSSIFLTARDITERRRAEDSLRDSEQLLRACQKVAGLGSYVLDIQTGTWSSSAILDGIFGIDESFVRTVEGWSSLIHPDWREQVIDHFTNWVLAKHNRFDKEYQIVRQCDGQKRWVYGMGELEFNKAGQPVKMFGTILDITEAKGAEEELKDSESKFRTAFMTSVDAFLIATLKEGFILDVNNSFTEVFGYRADEACGRTSTQLGLYANLDRGRIMSELSAKGYVSNLEFEALRKNGERRSVLVSANVMKSKGEELILAVVKDITEQERAEAGMRTLTTAVEQADEAIVITDLTGAIQYCNPAFSRLTGYPKEEAIGQNPRVLKSGKQSEQFYEDMWASIVNGHVWTGHLINKKRDGSLYEEDATISPIRDASGKLSGFVAIKRDMTERIRLEDQLRQAQKLESIGRLAGGVAHDFNNLLTVINGYSGFLLKALKADDPLRSYAEEIATAGNRAASLTKQLLAFSRKQVIEPKVVDVNAIIRESAVMLRRLIGDDIALETHLDTSLGQVMADPDQVHQVIVNLAVNARDAMSDGGALDIETMNCELTTEDCTASHSDKTPGRYVLLTVTDTGHGMNETIRKDIFEPFFTTKAVGKGTGLGLATVYGIVRQNGGWIDVWSEVGVGTTFKLYLPRIDACAEEEEERSVPVGGGGETILVVEDQEAVRSFAKAALRQHGYQVIHAGDGDQALSVAKQHLGQIDLLVTDVVMPGLNGRELSYRLKEVRPNVKVLFISGYTADVIAQRGVLDPGVAFLHKPFGQEELAQKVREVLDRAL